MDDKTKNVNGQKDGKSVDQSGQQAPKKRSLPSYSIHRTPRTTRTIPSVYSGRKRRQEKRMRRSA